MRKEGIRECRFFIGMSVCKIKGMKSEKFQETKAWLVNSLMVGGRPQLLFMIDTNPRILCSVIPSCKNVCQFHVSDGVHTRYSSKSSRKICM